MFTFFVDLIIYNGANIKVRYFTMKNKKLILLTSCLLVFSSCSPNNAPKLQMGEITADDDGIHWAAVEGASKYSVVVNDGEAVEVTTPKYSFNESVGTYKLKISAISADSSHQNSDPANFTYETKYTSLSRIYTEGNDIEWDDYAGKGIEVKKQEDEQFVLVQGDSYTVTESDLYIVRAAAGYKDNFYYVSNPVESEAKKGIVVSVGATENFVLEDGSEADDYELVENYSVSKYASTSWVESAAAINLNTSNEGFSEGNCIQLQYWHHGVWFKYTKEIDLDKRYDTFSFKVQGQVATYTSLTFEITDHIVVSGQDLIGVYISYQINPVVDQWNYYTVSLDDPAWTVSYNNQKYPFAQIKSLLENGGYLVQSLADMMPFFSQFSFRVNATYDNNGTKAYMYFDDVVLSNSGKSTSKETPIKVGKTYAFESAAFNGKGTFNDDGTAILNLKMKAGGDPVELPVTYSIENSELRMISTTADYDFDATFTPEHNGDGFVISSVTGGAAEALEGFKAEKYFVLDDFESYSETGQGYDNNHKDPTQVSGLRAAYAADWYHTGNDYAVSAIGDANWKLMGSTDYLELSKTGGMNGSKAMKFKYSTGGAMRYTTAGLITGEAKPFTGKTFSFFAKGTSDNNVRVKVRVFSTNQLTKSNHTSDEVSVMKEITILKNSDWTEYTVDLKEGTTYYGVSFTTQVDKNTTAQYPLIDNINVYGSISPWSI